MSSSAADRHPRVVILPSEIAGYASRLAEGLREEGWSVDVVDLSGNPYDYRVEAPDRWVLRAINRIHASSRRGGAFGLALAGVVSAPLRLWAALRVIHEYDAVISLFGRSLAWGADTRIAKKRGRRGVAVFLGSDSRPPYLSGNYMNTGEPVRWGLVRFRTWQMQRRVRRTERWADVVVCNPASAQFLGAPFVNWFAIGMPSTSRQERPAREPAIGPLRALHAPSRPSAKGTERIIQAVAGTEGRMILEVLTGVPNWRIQESLADCDVVIDEVFSDTPMAGLGSEAAARGVPAFAFGYAGPSLDRYFSLFGIPHQQYARPEELDTALGRIISDPDWVQDIARTTHSLVEGRWSPRGVARSMLLVLNDEIPDDWWIDPADLEYFWGYGMDRETAIAGWRELHRRYGVKVFRLADTSAVLTGMIEAIRPGTTS